MKALLFRLVAAALGIGIACVIGEAGLRLGGYSRSYVNPFGAFHESIPVIGYRGRPNFVGRFRTAEFDAVIAHDANGFRRQEHQTPLAQSRHKVLVFGDSFVWGWGVPQGDELTDQLSLLLPGYHVMNFGLSGSGTVQQHLLFEKFGTAVLGAGDTVLLLFFGNDFNDNVSGFLPAMIEDGQVHVGAPTKPGPTTSMIRDSSYLVNFVTYAANRLGAAFRRRKEGEWAAAWTQHPEQSREVVVLRHFLTKFRDTCAAAQARFVVAYIPERGEYGEEPQATPQRLAIERTYRSAFFATAQGLGIPTIDLLPSFLAAKHADPQRRLTFAHDEHWNAAAHALAARTVAPFIADADR